MFVESQQLSIYVDLQNSWISQLHSTVINLAETDQPLWNKNDILPSGTPTGSNELGGYMQCYGKFTKIQHEGIIAVLWKSEQTFKLFAD